MQVNQAANHLISRLVYTDPLYFVWMYNRLSGKVISIDAGLPSVVRQADFSSKCKLGEVLIVRCNKTETDLVNQSLRRVCRISLLAGLEHIGPFVHNRSIVIFRHPTAILENRLYLFVT
jgi:hypothetical protein